MIIYDLFFLIFSLIYMPYLIIKGKAHKDFLQRFGMLPSNIKSSKNPIWVHAVSVGEVLAAKDFIKKIKNTFPDKEVILSTTTKTGNEVAGKVLSDVPRFYFPLDFSFVVKSVIKKINPSLLIIMETEIWPNLIIAMSKEKKPVAIINGRISDRSFKGYLRIKFLFSKILDRISLFCMRTKDDAGRIKKLGAEDRKIKITGNMKFDVDLVESCIDTEKAKLEFGIGISEKLIIAGSTHPGEESTLFDIYNKLSVKIANLRIMIAPRHIDRCDSVRKEALQKGLKVVMASELKRTPDKDKYSGAVIILDTLGELSGLYSIADIVFLGGSLIKKGGHNIVEPAIFGKPIVFGQYMSNFRDMAKSFIENDAAMKANSEEELFNTLEDLLLNKKKRESLGVNAKQLIEKSRGAIERNVNEIAVLLKENNI